MFAASERAVRIDWGETGRQPDGLRRTATKTTGRTWLRLCPIRRKNNGEPFGPSELSVELSTKKQPNQLNGKVNGSLRTVSQLLPARKRTKDWLSCEDSFRFPFCCLG